MSVCKDFCHMQRDAQSYDMHVALCEKLREDPSLLGKLAEHNARLMREHPRSLPWLSRWRGAIMLGVDEVVRVASAKTDLGQVMRSCSPFSIIADQKWRHVFLQKWNRKYATHENIRRHPLFAEWQAERKGKDMKKAMSATRKESLRKAAARAFVSLDRDEAFNAAWHASRITRGEYVELIADAKILTVVVQDGKSTTREFYADAPSAMARMLKAAASPEEIDDIRKTPIVAGPLGQGIDAGGARFTLFWTPLRDVAEELPERWRPISETVRKADGILDTIIGKLNDRIESAFVNGDNLTLAAFERGCVMQDEDSPATRFAAVTCGTEQASKLADIVPEEAVTLLSLKFSRQWSDAVRLFSRSVENPDFGLKGKDAEIVRSLADLPFPKGRDVAPEDFAVTREAFYAARDKVDDIDVFDEALSQTMRMCFSDPGCEFMATAQLADGDRIVVSLWLSMDEPDFPPATRILLDTVRLSPEEACAASRALETEGGKDFPGFPGCAVFTDLLRGHAAADVSRIHL